MNIFAKHAPIPRVIPAKSNSDGRERFFTPDELETIQCALKDACFDSENRIAVLVYSSPEDTYLQEQLEHHRERLAKCVELLKKIKELRLNKITKEKTNEP